MGLLLDLAPDGGMDDEGNDEELEAELLNLVGGGGGGGGRPQGKKEGRGEEDKSHPLPSQFFLPIHVLVIKMNNLHNFLFLVSNNNFWFSCCPHV